MQTVSASWRGSRPQRRVLVSDFLLVQMQGLDRWYQFRDVREVDGQAVADRDGRLTQLFLQPAETAIEQATTIAAEGARYNLQNVGTLNYPLQPAPMQDSYYSPDMSGVATYGHFRSFQERTSETVQP